MEITKNEVNEFQRGVRERTVPEGMSWPMFEDGKAVALGDATEDCRCVTRICFTKKGFYFNSSHRKGPAPLPLRRGGEASVDARCGRHKDHGRRHGLGSRDRC